MFKAIFVSDYQNYVYILCKRNTETKLNLIINLKFCIHFMV